MTMSKQNCENIYPKNITEPKERENTKIEFSVDFVILGHSYQTPCTGAVFYRLLFCWIFGSSSKRQKETT